MITVKVGSSRGAVPGVVLAFATVLVALAPLSAAALPASPTLHGSLIPGPVEPSSTPEPPVPDVTAGASGSDVTAAAKDTRREDASLPEPAEPEAARASGPVLVQFMHAEACGTFSAGEGFEELFPCSDGIVRDHSDVCGESPVILPTWRRERASESVDWGEWVMVADLSCGGGPVPSPDQVLAEFRRLPLAPSPLTLQPDSDEVLVRMDTIAYTDPAPQRLSTTLLGVPVQFTVFPVAFTWDFGPDGGEGAPFTTTSPGHAYPHQDVAYAYRHVGTGHVTLTTTWAATYTVGADPTVRDVPGTATTTSTSRAFEIRELHTHLVAGTCAQNPANPGC